MIPFLLLLNSIFFLFFCLQIQCKEDELKLDDEDRSLWLNDKKIISFRSGSINLRFISYLFNHSDRSVTVSELEKNVFFDNSINLNKVMRNTAIPTHIAEQHFEYTKDSIKLYKKRTSLIQWCPHANALMINRQGDINRHCVDNIINIVQHCSVPFCAIYHSENFWEKTTHV